jgi:hypothetical protein
MFFVRQSTYDRMSDMSAHYFNEWLREIRKHQDTARELFERTGERDGLRRQLQRCQRFIALGVEARRPDDV